MGLPQQGQVAQGVLVNGNPHSGQLRKDFTAKVWKRYSITVRHEVRAAELACRHAKPTAGITS